MRGLTFEKPINRYSLSECYTNFLTILRIYRTTMNKNKKNFHHEIRSNRQVFANSNEPIH